MLSWDSREALARCRADAHERYLASPLLVLSLAPQELLRFCPMAAVLPPNEGMIPPEMNNEALGGLKLPLPGDAQATAGGGEEEVTLLRVFSYCKFPRGLEERRRVGVEKHPFSPCFAHPVLLLPSKPVGRASSSCLLLLFHTRSVHRYCCQF